MSSQVSSLLFYSKTRRLTAYILLFIQFFLPVSMAFSAVVQAAEAPDFTVRDHNDFFSTPAFSGEESVPPSRYGNIVHQDDILSTLPTLGLPKTEGEKNASPEVQVAQGASQAGRLLSNGDARDASIEYARSLGENLINQQITDWMNQYGKARVQLSTNKTGDADLLLPLIDKTNSLVFSQVGIRANEYRNTTNLGIGYRQYQADWMWGVNSFYDYDLTGGNSRVGVGSELWFDYLKFAGNGYFRLTDWHQSDLHAMRDYDERPANGFDLRAEGYLPSYPQLGAYAKYEQYFGKNINLSNSSVSVSDLKDNPSRSTLGVSYTPFPLITLKGETSRGDSNDSRVGLELTYRFGVPLNQQLDPEYVDSMRNLAGNRYDFVDRNYNIVMQYRKQELLTISLPDSMSAEAAALLPVIATVNKSKYGLKSIAWSAPELIAQGGKIQITSPTTINLTLPANVFQTRANKPQSYRVSAVGTDNEGNTSNMAVMWVNVKPSQEIVTSLTLSPNMVLLANNSDTYTATALIKNEIGEVLVNKDVTFTVSGFTDNEKVILTDGNGDTGQTVTMKTDINGQALITIKSKIAGNGVLKANMKDGSFRNTTLRFAADVSTAQIATLVLTNDKALANGKATNVAVATVQDQFGNVVEGFELASSASNGAMVVTQSQATNAQGQVTTSFTNFAAGSSVLTVSGTGTQKNVTAQFIADISTAKIASVVVDNDNAVANGQDRNAVTVTVVDGNGNVLANAPVTITVPNSGKYSTLPANGLTNSQGQLVVYYTNTKAGTENYPVSINNSQDMAVLAFVGDVTTARVVSVEFDGTLTEKIANGMNTFKFTAKVEDAKGNPVKDILVAWSKTTGASLLPILPGTMTDTNGLASVELTSTTTIDLNILVSAQVGATEKINANTKVSFIADKDTATITDANLTVETNNQLADGVANNQLKAVVTDARGNLVPNVGVVFTATNGGLPATQTVITNASGEARFDVTNTTAGITTVQASINGTDVSKGVTFIAGKPVASLSVLSTDSGSYTAGGEIIVSAVLKDAQGNAVSGETDLLNDSYAVLNVQGAERKTGSVWTESSTKGTYLVIYTAVTAGTGLKATVKLADWTAVVESAAYAIEADASSAMISASVLDNGKKLTPADGITTYDVKILVNDKYGNIVKLYFVTLTSPVLTNPKTVSTSDDGSVTTSISSAIAGSNDVTITSSTNSSVDEVRVTLKYSIISINVSNPLP